MLIAIIFIYEAFAKLFEINHKKPVNLHPHDPLDYTCLCNMSAADLTEDASELKYTVLRYHGMNFEIEFLNGVDPKPVSLIERGGYIQNVFVNQLMQINKFLLRIEIN